MITLTKIRELDLADTGDAGMPRHLSAASGLVCVGSSIYVVADDELHLGVFDAAGNAPGRLLRLFDGELPAEKKPRARSRSPTSKRSRSCRRSGTARTARCWRSAPARSATAAAAHCCGSTRAAPSTARRVCSTSRRCSKSSTAIVPR